VALAQVARTRPTAEVTSCDVVLLNPGFRGAQPAEHLGLAYLAAGLRQAGVGTQIIDMHLLGASVRQVVESVQQASPIVVGITGTERQGRALVAIAQYVRARLPRAHIAAGGHFATFCHDRLVRDVPALDSVVRGEGDLVFVELVKRVLAAEDWRGLPGVSFHQDGTVVSNPPSALIANLDNLPFPARDTARAAMARNGLLGVTSSRGCYGQCTFCSIRAFYSLQVGPAWRARSPENVVEEMALLARDYGCHRFWLVDDSFIGPGPRGRERAHAFADEVLSRGLKLEFAIFSRANDVGRDLFLHLRHAGLRLVEIGVESGNQSQLDRFRKGTTVEDGRRAMRTLRDLGVDVSVALVMFDPESTLGEGLDTLRFVAGEGVLGNASGFDNAANPHRGTELFERLRREGRLRGSYLKGYSYSFRDPIVGACARVARPLGRLLAAVPNPFAPRRHKRAVR